MNIHDLKSVTIEDIENHKLISVDELKYDLNRLRQLDSTTNINNFYGNRFLYHYQFKNLLRCKRIDTKKTIYDIYNDETQYNKLLENTVLRNRKGKSMASNIYECYRMNLGSIVMFKASTAKYLYQKYNATKVLDPTMGWGGRMLGAWALDIDYTGIDTNIELKQAYTDMLIFLKNEATVFGNGLFSIEQNSNINLLWQNALDVDFSEIEYDFVLTSPPYINLEVYEHMELYANDRSFYVDFLIPLYHKCINNIKVGGHVCFNISPKMYVDAMKYGLPECSMEEDLLQQTGKRQRHDKIYVWK